MHPITPSCRALWLVNKDASYKSFSSLMIFNCLWLPSANEGHLKFSNIIPAILKRLISLEFHLIFCPWRHLSFAGVATWAIVLIPIRIHRQAPTYFACSRWKVLHMPLPFVVGLSVLHLNIETITLNLPFIRIYIFSFLKMPAPGKCPIRNTSVQWTAFPVRATSVRVLVLVCLTTETPGAAPLPSPGALFVPVVSPSFEDLCTSLLSFKIKIPCYLRPLAHLLQSLFMKKIPNLHFWFCSLRDLRCFLAP